MGSELTPEVLADLRAKAEKATPGPWPENYVWGAVRHIDRNVDRSLFCDDADGAMFSWDRDTDGYYIAAANPATVLALLDEIERLRTELTAALLELAMVREKGSIGGGDGK